MILRTTWRALAMILALGALNANVANASLVAYTGFDYGQPGVLGGKSSVNDAGFGSNSWNNSSTNHSLSTVTLAYPGGTDLSSQAGSVGKSAIITGNALDNNRTLSPTRNLINPFYVSFQVRFDHVSGGSAKNVQVQLRNGAAGAVKLDVSVGSTGQFRLGKNDSTLVSSAESFVQGATYFFVAKLDPSINTASLQIYNAGGDTFFPSTIGAEPTSWYLTQGDGQGATISGPFNNVRIVAGINSLFVLDELRIGTTWESVVGVPEPAAGSLAFCGLLGLAALRRRRASVR